MNPISDRVIVKTLESESVTRGGIIIPDSAKKKSRKGKVIAVGPGNKDYDMTVEVGDIIHFELNAGTEITIGGEKFLILRESDIYFIYDKV